MTPEHFLETSSPVSTYVRENVYYTFGEFNFVLRFFNLLLHVGVDRMMFSADHRYALMANAHIS